MKTSDKLDLLAPALVALQGELKNVARDSDNPFFDSKYSSLPGILDELRPMLLKHGFSMVQFPYSNPGEDIGLTTRILHLSGQWMEETFFVKPVEATVDKDSKSKAVTPQTVGSAITYMRRYAVAAVWGIASEDDDDGNAASGQSAKAAKKQIPEDGKFVDVIAEIKLKKETDTYKLFLVNTGEHGQFSCWGTDIGKIESFNGTGEAMQIKVAKNKYGYEFKGIEKIPAEKPEPDSEKGSSLDFAVKRITEAGNYTDAIVKTRTEGVGKNKSWVFTTFSYGEVYTRNEALAKKVEELNQSGDALCLEVKVNPPYTPQLMGVSIPLSAP